MILWVFIGFIYKLCYNVMSEEKRSHTHGIQTIRAFVAVVDYKSFSEAAKHLYLTQPTISSHIQALEKELNSRLLIRTTKQMKVTDRGMQLYECAVHMLNMRNQITDEFVGNKWKLIDVSASTIPSSYLLPELLSEFSKIQPDIHFHIWQSDSADAIEKSDPGRCGFWSYRF